MATSEKPGKIDAVGVFTTRDEIAARRVLAWLNNTGYRNAAGFVYAEGYFEIIIKADVGEEHAPGLAALAQTMAAADTRPAGLQNFRQFERM